MKNSNVLSLETSTEYCSVSLFQNGKELYGAIFFLHQTHSRSLAVLAEKAIRIAGVSWSELSAVAIGKGPGSYTGLRIATSLAKGICLAQNIPLISVSTLRNLAFQAFESQPNAELALVSIDARRMEVYMAIFDQSGNAFIQPIAQVLGMLDLDELLRDKNIVLTGDGSQKVLNFYQNPVSWRLIPGIFPDSKTLGILAYQAMDNKQFEEISSYEPEYVKPVYITK